MILVLGETLEEIHQEQLNDSTVSAVFITNPEHAERAMQMAGRWTRNRTAICSF